MPHDKYLHHMPKLDPANPLPDDIAPGTPCETLCGIMDEFHPMPNTALERNKPWCSVCLTLTMVSMDEFLQSIAANINSLVGTMRLLTETVKATNSRLSMLRKVLEEHGMLGAEAGEEVTDGDATAQV